MKSIYNIALLIFFAVGVSHSQSTELKEAIFNFQSSTSLTNASWSISAIDIIHNKKIIDQGASISLVPASTLKTLTTGIALSKLGAEYQFETQIGFTGSVQDGVLDGDLIIIGGGDPSLGMIENQQESPLKIIHEFLKKNKIDRIEGQLIADLSHYERLLTPDTWIYQDLGNYYGASPSALCYLNNQFQITFGQNNSPGEKTTLVEDNDYPKGLNIINEVISGPSNSGDQAYVYGFPGSDTYVLKGSIPSGLGTFTIKASNPNPAMTFLQYLRKELQNGEISIKGEDSISYLSIKGVQNLGVIKSVSLKDLIREVNVNSNNLFAEQIMLEMKSRSTLSAMGLVKDFFETQGLSNSSLYIADGSGLSKYNTICTSEHVEFLQMMYKEECFEDYLKSLPKAGKEGTVSNFLKDSPENIEYFLKSGSLNRVRAYSGYIRKGEGIIAVSFIVNNFRGSSSEMRSLMEEVLMAFKYE